jgi:hypothetical protein
MRHNWRHARENATYFFDPEPGTFARIANVLNIANVAPNRVSLELKRNDGTLGIYIELRVGLRTAQAIQRKLAQLTDVIHADMSILPSIIPVRRFQRSSTRMRPSSY